MFYNFNAHKSPRGPENQEPEHHPAVAERIFQKGVSLQKKWAGFMGRQAGRLSGNGLKALCLGILLSAAAYSAYLVCDGLMTLATYKVPDRAWPAWVFDPSGKKSAARKAAAFKRYLDSLQKSFLQDSIDHLSPNPYDHANRH